MKKIISVLIIVVIIMSFCACRNKNNKNNNAANVEIVVGDPVTDKEIVNFYDENHKQYTAENLPDGYNRSDFDGDGLNNKDEIAAGTDMYKVDTDGDGVGDHDEIYKTKTDPLKWSSRDDEVSDLEYSILNTEAFEAGWTSTDMNGFKIYNEKVEDRLCIISKTSTNVFDGLETISEAFQIKYFSGKIALNCSKYVAEVANSIGIYKDVDGIATKIESTVDENNLVIFELNENDVFVVVYIPH